MHFDRQQNYFFYKQITFWRTHSPEGISGKGDFLIDYVRTEVSLRGTKTKTWLLSISFASFFVFGTISISCNVIKRDFRFLIISTKINIMYGI